MIELLIVMTIIATLSGLSIFAIRGAASSGRDARRKADLETIMSAMTLIKADCGQFPSTMSDPLATTAGSEGCPTGNTYMQDVPEDPTGGSYCYRRLSATTSCICADLENPPDTTSNCGGSCDAGACNYAVNSQ